MAAQMIAGAEQITHGRLKIIYEWCLVYLTYQRQIGMIIM